MTVKIGRKKYELSTSVMALIDYRAIFGASFLHEFSNSDSAEVFVSLIKLVYASLTCNRPDFDDFSKAAIADGNFLPAAFAVKDAIFRKPDNYIENTTTEIKQTADNAVDELSIIAIAAILPIPQMVLDRFPLFDVLKIVSEITKIKNPDKDSPKKSYHEMSNSEVCNFYF